MNMNKQVDQEIKLSSRNQTNLQNLVCPVAQTTNSTNCTPRALNDMDTCPLPSLISTACGKETQLQI